MCYQRPILKKLYDSRERDIKYNKNIIEEKIHNLENDLLSVVGVVGLSPSQVEKNATGSPVPRHNYSVLFLLVVVSLFFLFKMVF